MSTKPVLRVRRECDTSYIHGHDHTGNPCQGSYWEPATVADVLDWLIAEGGEIADSVGVTFADMPQGFDGLILAVESRAWTATPGRYLVYGPLPAEETTTT